MSIKYEFTCAQCNTKVTKVRRLRGRPTIFCDECIDKRRAVQSKKRYIRNIIEGRVTRKRPLTDEERKLLT